MEKPRVLLTYIESGMGHIMSMRAIEDGLKKYSDKIDIITTDIMKDEHDETAIKFEKFYNLVKFLRPSFDKQKSNLLFWRKESMV